MCSRSIASVAIDTAVSNPNVTSVPSTSLSIVFGTPITRGSPRPISLCAIFCDPSPPTAMSASNPCSLNRATSSSARSTGTSLSLPGTFVG